MGNAKNLPKNRLGRRIRWMRKSWLLLALKRMLCNRISDLDRLISRDNKDLEF